VSNYLKSKKNSFHADEEACNLDEATEEDAITVSLIFFSFDFVFTAISWRRLNKNRAK
jgi:hypothetical protein